MSISSFFQGLRHCIVDSSYFEHLLVQLLRLHGQKLLVARIFGSLPFDELVVEVLELGQGLDYRSLLVFVCVYVEVLELREEEEMIEQVAVDFYRIVRNI